MTDGTPANPNELTLDDSVSGVITGTVAYDRLTLSPSDGSGGWDNYQLKINSDGTFGVDLYLSFFSNFTRNYATFSAAARVGRRY